MKNLKYLLLCACLLSPVYAVPIALELNGGSVINGELIAWDGQEAQIKAEFGTLKFKKETISKKTLNILDLQSGDPKKLASRITELESTVASLRRDNAALRQQLEQAAASPAPASGVAASSNPTQPRSTAVERTGVSYSRSSTGKRHNSNCRYFGSGSPCGPADGVACKICGG